MLSSQEQAAELNEVSGRAHDLQRYAQPLIRSFVTLYRRGIQNTVFKASNVEICHPVTKTITNDRIRDILQRFETEAKHEFVFAVGPTGGSASPGQSTGGSGDANGTDDQQGDETDDG